MKIFITDAELSQYIQWWWFQKKKNALKMDHFIYMYKIYWIFFRKINFSQTLSMFAQKYFKNGTVYIVTQGWRQKADSLSIHPFLNGNKALKSFDQHF